MMPPETRGSRFEGHRYPQVIPDPGEIRPGGPAPWAQVSERRHLTLARVPRATGQRAPALGIGLSSGVARGARGRRRPRPVTRRSAVLVALFEEEGETQVVLTRRSLSHAHAPGRGLLSRRTEPRGRDARPDGPARGERGGRPEPVVGHDGGMADADRDLRLGLGDLSRRRHPHGTPQARDSTRPKSIAPSAWR